MLSSWMLLLPQRLLGGAHGAILVMVHFDLQQGIQIYGVLWAVSPSLTVSVSVSLCLSLLIYLPNVSDV